MACSAHDIPTLEFPRDEIIEVIPGKLLSVVMIYRFSR